jgi:hypothetical protein
VRRSQEVTVIMKRILTVLGLLGTLGTAAATAQTRVSVSFGFGSPPPPYVREYVIVGRPYYRPYYVYPRPAFVVVERAPLLVVRRHRFHRYRPHHWFDD